MTDPQYKCMPYLKEENKVAWYDSDGTMISVKQAESNIDISAEQLQLQLAAMLALEVH